MRPPQRKITEEDRRIIKLAEDMRGLIRFKPFLSYLEVLKAHEEGKVQELLAPAAATMGGPGQDALSVVLRAEANKGAIAAFKLARTIPQGIIASSDQIMAEVSLPEDGE